jgi:hypothetical protein
MSELEEVKELLVKEPIKEPITFDPTKKYTWEKDTAFTLSGSEFGLLLNALRAVTNTQEAQALFLASEASKVIEGSLAKAVEAGIVVELPETV